MTICLTLYDISLIPGGIQTTNTHPQHSRRETHTHAKLRHAYSLILHICFYNNHISHDVSLVDLFFSLSVTVHQLGQRGRTDRDKSTGECLPACTEYNHWGGESETGAMTAAGWWSSQPTAIIGKTGTNNMCLYIYMYITWHFSLRLNIKNNSFAIHNNQKNK